MQQLGGDVLCASVLAAVCAKVTSLSLVADTDVDTSCQLNTRLS